MLSNKRIIDVLPTFNAEKPLYQTYTGIPFDIVDEVLHVDDSGSDKTLALTRPIWIMNIIEHKNNKVYGGTRKSCYDKALALGADIDRRIKDGKQANQ
ncbi:MAG: hypothetical protein WCI48_10455 [Bacteroidota bacterium]|jgi:hypothetical protein